MTHNDYMSLALIQGQKAFKSGEIPVGAVITWNDTVIASAYNQCEQHHDPTAHAEIIAIKKASEILGNWRLTGCTLYVTIEPCPMCAGAAVNARLSTIVYGASDIQNGGIDSKFCIVKNTLNHTISVISGICANECQQLMDKFFTKRRHLSK